MEFRAARGFDSYHPSTRWLWVGGSNPCPRCLEKIGSILSGPEILSVLPYSMQVSSTEIKAEYHEVINFRTPCYCRLELINPEELAETQLNEDMEAAITSP